MLKDELAAFYQRYGFGDVVGSRPRTVPVYTGCLLVPLPNIETRRKYLKYHDLHHLMTRYSVGRIGEGEVSAWELGTGTMFASPMLGLMNLIALSTGLFLEPGRMWQAFRRGCRSKNLYSAKVRKAIDVGRWVDVEALKGDFLDTHRLWVPLPMRALEFAFYSAAAVLIHAAIAIPAVIARFVTDITLGYSFFEAVKPRKRADLF
jgi:hypothetical protein